jgi:5'-nucleotidase
MERRSSGVNRAITHLGEVEVADEPEEGSDSAVLAAGHPTLTALRSVTEAEGDLVQRWLFVRVGGGSRSPVEH